MKITITTNGPYLIEGDAPLADQHIVTNDAGDSLEWREGKARPHAEKYALCRCGQSAKKPFCDGAHKRTGFDGTESATREPYEQQAQRFEGPAMVLEDASALCAYARFCDPKGKVWNLIKTTDDPETAKLVEHEAGHCPAGRLLAKKKPGGEALEPHHAPSIGLIQDTSEGVSGPLWVRGGIPVVGADGVPYEVRNRVTLCRCGASKNKPFCDGAHASIGFTDGSRDATG
jgi:CDGSH-type Zn-finger protein